jgi:hypothetical protein
VTAVSSTMTPAAFALARPAAAPTSSIDAAADLGQGGDVVQEREEATTHG